MTAVSDSNGRPISRKPEARRCSGRSFGTAAGKEAVDQQLGQPASVATSTETVPPISLLPRPSTEIVLLVGSVRRQQRLLGRAAGMPQGDRLPRVEVGRPVSAKSPGHVVGQGQVHVVAADQQVVAHGDPLEHQLALFFATLDQRQVGRAAADVADQQRVAHRQPLPPRSPVSASQA